MHTFFIEIYITFSVKSDYKKKSILYIADIQKLTNIYFVAIGCTVALLFL
jgi:hypothetical protein